jgi:uncharacterized membrane protein
MKLHSEKARAVALLTDALLAMGLCAWSGWIAGLVLSLPLLLIFRGLWKRDLYTAKWGSLALVFYTALLLAEAYAIRSRHWIGLGLSAIAAIEFVSVNLYVRLNARERIAGIG